MVNWYKSEKGENIVGICNHRKHEPLSGCRSSVFTCEQRLDDSILLVHLTGVVLLDYLLDAWGLSDLGCAPSPGLIVLGHLEDP